MRHAAHGSRRRGRSMVDEGWSATSPDRPPRNTTPTTRKPCSGVMTMVAHLVRPAESRTRTRRPARRIRSKPTITNGVFPRWNPLGHRADRTEFKVPIPVEAGDRRCRAPVTNRTQWRSGKPGEFSRVRTALDSGGQTCELMAATSPHRHWSAVTNPTHWGSGKSGEFHWLCSTRDPGGRARRRMVASSPIGRRSAVTNPTHWEFGNL